MNQSNSNKQPGFLPNDVEALKRSIANNLRYRTGRNPLNANRHDWLLATELAVRNRLVERWMSTSEAFYTQKAKNIYYLSMEFLIGRTFTNSIQALDISQEVKEALADLSVDYEEIASGEPDAALGNGGLGKTGCLLPGLYGNVAIAQHGLRSALRIWHVQTIHR